MEEPIWREKLYQRLGLDPTAQPSEQVGRPLRYRAANGASAALDRLSTSLIEVGDVSLEEMGVGAMNTARALISKAFHERRLTEEDVRKLFDQALRDALGPP